VYGAAKYIYSVHQYKNVVNSNSAELERLQKLIDSMPSTQADYENFLKTGDKDIVEIYNNALAEAKLSQEPSQEFLSEHGMDSEMQFWDKLDALYQDGKAGNDAAREEFNSLMTDYQNMQFSDAKVQAEKDYLAIIDDLDAGTMDGSVDTLDAMLNLDFSTTLVGVACIAMCVAYVLEYAKKHHDKKTGKYKVKEKKSIFKRMKEKLVKDEIASIKEKERREKLVDEKKAKIHISKVKKQKEDKRSDVVEANAKEKVEVIKEFRGRKEKTANRAKGGISASISGFKNSKKPKKVDKKPTIKTEEKVVLTKEELERIEQMKLQAKEHYKKLFDKGEMDR